MNGYRDGDHILCCICQASIPRDEWATGIVWTDPAGQSCVAHFLCLAALGEYDLKADSPW